LTFNGGICLCVGYLLSTPSKLPLPASDFSQSCIHQSLADIVNFPGTFGDHLEPHSQPLPSCSGLFHSGSWCELLGKQEQLGAVAESCQGEGVCSLGDRKSWMKSSLPLRRAVPKHISLDSWGWGGYCVSACSSDAQCTNVSLFFSFPPSHPLLHYSCSLGFLLGPNTCAQVFASISTFLENTD
jgi:hypothetical protein